MWQASFLVLLGLAVILPASAGPISSCKPNNSGHITCNLYETDALGNGTNTPPPVAIGSVVNLGFVVFLEPGVNPNIGANDINVSNWSDVLDFFRTGNTYYVQLFSDSFSKSFSQTILSDGATFVSEAASESTVYIGGSGNTYNVVSGAPEPATLPLVGAALLAIGLVTFRKRAVS